MERPHLIAEVAGRPAERIRQEINLCHWDRFIEVVGEGMKQERDFVKDPKNSYLDIRDRFQPIELSKLIK